MSKYGVRESFSNPIKFTGTTQHAEWIFNKIEILSMGPSWGERACIRGLEYTLFEILD